MEFSSNLILIIFRENKANQIIFKKDAKPNVYSYHAQCHTIPYSESIKPLSVLHSGLKREWQPTFSTFFGQKKFQTFFLNFL